MSKEKTLESVLPPEDEKKETVDQAEVPSHEDEELVDDTSSDSDDEDVSERKPFKTRAERAAFFKQKQSEKSRDDVLTKSDLYKMNERVAIRDITTPGDNDPAELKELKSEINDNWDAIVPHFNPSIDRSDVVAIREGIIDAYTVWKRHTGGAPKQKSDDTDIKARAALMADSGVPASTGKGAAQERKSILGKQSKGMEDWYPAKSN